MINFCEFCRKNREEELKRIRMWEVIIIDGEKVNFGTLAFICSKCLIIRDIIK